MQNKHKLYTVRVTETAWNMLTTHAQFVANVSLPAANRLVDAFNEATERLSQMPRRNPWLEHDTIPYQKYRKQLFSKHYLALYEIQDEIVYISAVVDCRQDYIRLL